MASIVIDDLEESSDLDRKAMADIRGGQIDNRILIWERWVRTEGIGTFMDQTTGEIRQRFRNIYIQEVADVNYAEKSFIGPISTWPVPGSGP